MLAKWIDRLTRQAGVPFSYACEETTARIPEDMRVIFHMMTDAAKAGAAVPGLGGFLHGLWWAVALEPRDVVGDLQIPIPVLEFAAIAIGVIVFAPIVGVAAMAIYSDSLTSTDVIAKRRWLTHRHPPVSSERGQGRVAWQAHLQPRSPGRPPSGRSWAPAES